MFKLNNALYELKQAPRVWNTKLNDTLIIIRFFFKSKNDQSVYFLSSSHNEVIFEVYVDDLITTGQVRSNLRNSRRT